MRKFLLLIPIGLCLGITSAWAVHGTGAGGSAWWDRETEPASVCAWIKDLPVYERCFDVVQDGVFFDGRACTVCASIRNSVLRLRCMEAIRNRDYSKVDLGQCIISDHDFATVQCMAHSGTPKNLKCVEVTE